MEVLGIPISTLSQGEILATIRNFFDEQKFHRIATVNPEFLVLAEKDEVFKKSLQSADLCVADGIGIVWAGWMQGKKVTRFPGADLLHEILVMAERNDHAVYLAIKKDGLSSYEEIQAALVKMYPNIKMSGVDMDVCMNHESGVMNHDSQFIRHARPQRYAQRFGRASIILCNFGAPDQELFLESLRNHPGDVRLAMGVGGAFDFLTGKQKRAPRCLRTIGLEWFWRLILQPKRWKRIWNAVVMFPFRAICSWQKKQKKL